jgi:glycosyltransferase involved in cell wall biosynthesis
MRVLHVIPGLSAKDGGPTTALHRMAAATAAAGADVTVVTSDDDAGGRLDVPLGKPLQSNGVRYLYFARSLPGSWKASWGLTRWIASNIRSFDVVHVHALFSYSTIPGCRFAFRAGVPVVLRPLGTASPWSLAHHGWKKRPYYSLVERSHLRRAAAIHVTSEAERDGVVALGFGDRAVVVPLGVDVGPAASAQRSAGERLRLLFVSRLHPVKNVPLLLETLALLRRDSCAVELTIAGDGAPDYRAQLQRDAQRLGLNGTVRFIGHVDGARKRALFAESDAFVLPSQHENFGIAAAEAMGAGLPVVISDQVGLADEVRAAGAGIVVPAETQPIANALRELASDATARQAMGARAIALARERYSWSGAAKSLIELYAGVVAERSAEARRSQ